MAIADTLASLRRIVIASDDPVFQTAATELAWSLHPLPVVVSATPTAGDAVLCVIDNPLAAPLILDGLTDLHNVAPARDGFHVIEHQQCLWILGGSKRGVLNAVYAVADALVCGADGGQVRGAFAFDYRIFSPIIGSGFIGGAGMIADDYRAPIRYVSRLGASHVAATHDFAGGPSRDLHAYVASDIYPLAADPAPRDQFRRNLRSIIDVASKFGLGVYFDSRLFACQGGPWETEAVRDQFLQRFPADVLSDSGTYQGKVLCFGHPTVQAFLREVIANFFADFPEVDVFHYLTMDAEGEFCDPETCPRCCGLGKFDQRDRLARFLAEEMPKARPGIKILNTGHQWDRSSYGIGQLLARQGMLPETIGLQLSATGDAATFERQAHDHLRTARVVTRRAGQLLIGRDTFHVFEDAHYPWSQRYDYPLGVFAKVRRWAALGYDGLYDARGRQTAADLHANAPAVRAALLDPAIDPRSFCDALAARWFGDLAGPLVASAWQTLECAHAIRSNGYAFPSSSPLSEYSPWHFSRAQTPLSDNPLFTSAMDEQAAPDYGEFAPASANGFIYREGDYADKLRTTGYCLSRSAKLCDDASELLADALRQPLPDSIADASLWLGPGTTVAPSDYLADHLAYVTGLARFGAIMGAYFTLKALRIATAGDTAAYLAEGDSCLRAYANAARALASHLVTMRDSGRIEGEFASNLNPELLRARASEVDACLASGSPPKS